jgi:hypothetical protein
VGRVAGCVASTSRTSASCASAACASASPRAATQPADGAAAPDDRAGAGNQFEGIAVCFQTRSAESR